MKQKTMFLVLGFVLVATLRAEDLKPPVPADANSDLLPPPVDIGQLTPLPLSNDGKTLPAPEAPAAVSPATPTPAPAKVEVKKKAAEPVPTNSPVPAPAASQAAPPVSLGAFADYFPSVKGTKWTYEYLKAEAGSKAKKTRTVECLSQEPAANGAVATFLVTDDGQESNEKYSLSNGRVEHTSSGDKSFSGDFVYQFPEAGGTTNWTVTDPSGAVHKSKACFGKAQVYKKVYPDCVIVTEKTGEGAKATTIFYYYAKGKGLVSMEVYGKGMKLALTKSFALVSGPVTP